MKGLLPTRVLDIGNEKSAGGMRLHCSQEGETGRYLALSHLWGKDRPLCTTSSTLERFQKRIEFQELPKTFQDAVTVTRQLGIRFLWIDSLCIVQDDSKDWETQSKLMGDVFTNAYCTIAASRAGGSSDGFLTSKKPRNAVAVTQSSGYTYYVCDAIDDFHSDVEEGELNKRGWVLQERALSHRTIYFTEVQIYWECGNGVHCETLTKLRKYVISKISSRAYLNVLIISLSPKSAFLGDSEFPESARTFYRGGRIRLYEEVYKQYSRLAFTFTVDRAIAISGLEKRLIRTFSTVGGYGIFAEYLNRSLLWQRSGLDFMEPIHYPLSKTVPSWSWMAYVGAITYVDIPLGKAQWFPRNITPPFRTGGDFPERELLALAKDLRLQPDEQGSNSVIFDTHDMHDSTELKCIVVARDRISDAQEVQRYYVLVITPKISEGTERTYRRVGAGFVKENEIGAEGALEVRIH